MIKITGDLGGHTEGQMILRGLKILMMKACSSLAGIPVVNLQYGAVGNNSCDLPHFQGPIFFRVTPGGMGLRSQFSRSRLVM